jgi:hypothetical protein
MLDFKQVNEQRRTYYYPQGEMVIDDVVKLAVPGSTHRLETKDGRKLIMNSNWMAIKLDVEDWSF